MFADDVRAGLTAARKTIPPKYFYDNLGSALFEAICQLPEYYVSRCELEILTTHGDDIADALGSPVRLIELGSGTSRKTRTIIERILQRQPKLEYVTVDIDEELVRQTAERLHELYPNLTVQPVVADFNDIADVAIDKNQRNVVLFLGSTIGNLGPGEQETLLRAIRRTADAFFLGADLRKDKPILDAAYDDALGVTAAFNLNLLVRINNELGGHFELADFAHRAFFNEAESRIEMHIVSRIVQRVRIDALDLDVDFDAGETIHTENSYKFDDARLDALARASGLTIARRWTDARRFFADVLLV